MAILAAEDLLGAVVVPRLIAAGADRERVYIVEGVRRVGDVGEPDALSLPLDLDLLRTVVKDKGIRFIYADALADVLPLFESHRDANTRRVLRPLAGFAREMGVILMGTRHFNKSPGMAAVNATSGSVAFSAVARVMVQVHQDTTDPDRRILAVAKANLARRPASLAFQLASDGPTDLAHVEWLGEDPRTADDLLAEAAAAAGDRAVGGGAHVDLWLRAILADGESDKRAVLEAAKAAGFPPRTIYRAADRLHVMRTQSGFSGGKRSIWRLPAAPLVPSMPIVPLSGSGTIGTIGTDGMVETDPDAVARLAMREGA